VRSLRGWLVFALVLALCVAYQLGWSHWVTVNTRIVYQQLPPGASAEWEGVTYTVTALQVVDAVAADGSDPVEAVEGAAWVEATLEVRTDQPGGLAKVVGRCQLELLGPDGIVWDSVLRYDDRPERCSDDTPGASATLVLSYQVPESRLSQLYGLVMPSNGAVRQVVRP